MFVWLVPLLGWLLYDLTEISFNSLVDLILLFFGYYYICFACGRFCFRLCFVCLFFIVLFTFGLDFFGSLWFVLMVCWYCWFTFVRLLFEFIVYLLWFWFWMFGLNCELRMYVLFDFGLCGLWVGLVVEFIWVLAVHLIYGDLVFSFVSLVLWWTVSSWFGMFYFVA